MDINLKQAVKYFFSNPSLELVFIEAIYNSIDAESTEINVEISIQEFSKPETLKITIKDNGVGFTNERFAKFSRLLEVDETSHKGIGRLVFLSYFERVDIISKYGRNQRTFRYSNDFDEKKANIVPIDEDVNETSLSFSNYYLSKIGKHEYLKPSYLRKKLLEEFYPRLYLMKQEKKKLKITLTLYVEQPDNRYDFLSERKEISIDEIEQLEIEPVEANMLAMFHNMEVHYSIKQKELEQTIITALCIDGRTYKLDIISDENIPLGYEIIFLLYSTYFDGKVNASRQELTLNDADLKLVRKLFQTKVAEILKLKIPAIVENNEKTKESLINTYPHLLGYFEKDTIGFIKREDSIRKAQEKFFKDQRDVLDANGLSEEVYEKSLELSSRALTEYILYRQLIINKIKSIDRTNSEADIHNLIVPKGKTLHKSDFMNDLYSNNAWLLDDKYMTYNTILSDKVMSDIVKKLTDEDAGKDNSEPDLALIFSNDPANTLKVDVVVVELKKRGIKLEETVTAITQLKKRATKLMNYYPHKIQRIWFYAIVEFSDEFKLYLENDRFTSLFSTDTMYYREDEMKLSLSSTDKCNIGIYVLSLDAFINDADVRNSTFLSILKENFKNRDIE
ncbi:MAG: ATP-binding protein [Bacteroidales bacterium]|nr:ATP-binding protein [Bacteroidales bacterium]